MEFEQVFGYRSGMKKRYQTIFFDLDDTLWDTSFNNKRSLQILFERHNFAKHYGSFDSFFSIYNPHNCKLWEDYSFGKIDRDTLILDRFLFVTEPMGITDPKEVLALSDEFLSITCQQTRLIPGAIDLLDYLKNHKKYAIHILSNGFREVQYLKLGNSGLMPYIDKVVLSEEAGVTKPDSKIFEFALEITGAALENTLMIGDNPVADIQGAINAGWDVLWFNPAQQPYEFEKNSPIETIAHLKEIESIL